MIHKTFVNIYFVHTQAIQQAAKQSRNKQRAPPPVGSQSSSSSLGARARANRNHNSSQPGPLTQGPMSQNLMSQMSQPGFSGLDFSQGDFIINESQGDGILSQDFTNSQGPDKFYSNFSQSQNF